MPANIPAHSRLLATASNLLGKIVIHNNVAAAIIVASSALWPPCPHVGNLSLPAICGLNENPGGRPAALCYS